MTQHAVVDSPVGPLTVVDDDGALAGLYLPEQRYRPATERLGPRDDGVLPGLREQLDGYFAGELQDFDVALAARGTPFQAQVWEALRAIPYGRTCTYAELAEAVGRRTAVRAVGAANGRNPISVVVPCHRVVGRSGALTGYAGGLDRKAALLQLEARATPARA